MGFRYNSGKYLKFIQKNNNNRCRVILNSYFSTDF